MILDLIWEKTQKLFSNLRTLIFGWIEHLVLFEGALFEGALSQGTLFEGTLFEGGLFEGGLSQGVLF